MSSVSKLARRGGAHLLLLIGITGLAQTSDAQESASLGTPKWFLQTLPREMSPDGNSRDAGLYTQTLPVVGRDDLWVNRPRRSTPTDQCDVVPRSAGSIPDYIVELARSTRIVIINEAHDIPWHRAFTESLLRPLWDQGFRYFAAEAFLEHINDYPGEDFGRIDAGFYATESTFGSLIRTAKQLGYHLVAYEAAPINQAQNYMNLKCGCVRLRG